MSVTGNGTNNVSANGAGNDTLTGAASGASTMVAAGAHDTFIVGNTGDMITDTSTGGEIDSSVNWNLGSTHSTGVNKLVLTGSTALTGTGNTSTDILVSSATGTDHLVGLAALGNDTFYVNHSGDVVTEATASGNLTTDRAVVYSTVSYALGTNIEDLNLSSGTGNLTGTGNTLANVITGNTGNDTLSDGDTANDSVVGFAGDTLIGNSANGGDTFIVNFSGDSVTEAHASVGGAVSLVESTASFTLGTNMKALTLSGTATITGTGNTSADILKSSTTGTNALIGHGGADTFYLNHAGDTATELNVGGGAAVISTISYTLTSNMSSLTLTGATAMTGVGNTSANVLTSGTGADTLYGHSSTGGDTFIVNNASDIVSEAGTNTGDLIISDVSFNLATRGSTSTASTNVNSLTLTGAGALTGTGNANADVLVSSTTGTDKLIGAGGNDTFYLNHAGDTATEGSALHGGATVNSTISYTLGANMSTLNLTGTGLTGAITATGNTGNDTITSTVGSGPDTFVGNTGADSFVGNGGADVFKVNGAGTTAVENNVAGHASVISQASFTLGANMSTLTLSGAAAMVGTGNTSANVLTSSTGGANTLIGNSAAGGDTFVINHAGDSISENGASATGDLITSVASFDLRNVGGTGAVNQLTLTGTAALTADGNTNGDVLTSNTGKDTLTGHSTSGADTFVVNNSTDTISEAGTTAASDVVISSTTFSLLASTTTAQMTHLTLTGASPITGTGNHLANILTSSATGTDKLIGNDTTAGTSDTFYVNHAGDTVTENGTGAADIVYSGISFTMGPNLDQLVLTGTTNLTGVGNTLANVITGNTGTDLLNDGGYNSTVGYAGDTLIGNSTGGTDTFIVNNTADVVSETNAATTSLIQTSVSWNLGGADTTHVNRATLTGTGSHLTLNGNTSGDVLIDATTSTGAGSGANTLIGNSVAGGDTFIINHTNDVISEAGSTLNELIVSTVSQTLLGSNAGAITLTGTSALAATGNTGADTLTAAASGADTLTGNTTVGGDTFYVFSTSDKVVENGSGTGDLVVSTVNFNLSGITGTHGANVNNLTLTGTAGLTGQGNTTAGVITSNTGKDVLIGHATSGHDTFVVNNATDTVSEAGVATGDLVMSSVSWTLGASPAFSGLTLTGAGAHLVAKGNTGADTITDATTGAGGNTLIGQSTAGADSFVVHAAGDLVSEAGTATGDSVTSYVSFGLATGTTQSTHFANLTLSGATNLTGTGNAGSNIITGNTGDDVLNDGTDTVVGAGDTLIGNSAAGNDTFIVSNTHDHVSEAVAATGLIDSSVSFNLGAAGVSNVNRLTLTAGSITATGNSANDTLTDGGTNDAFVGNSTDAGLTGGDTFILSHTGDTVTETNGNTAALIESSVGFNLATGAAGGGNTGVNQLTLVGGATGQTATGNSGNDLITDNDTVVGGGHNVLHAGASSGNDTLIDNAGNDTFYVNSTNDSVTEAFAGSTSAAVQSTVDYTLGAHINSLTLTAGGSATIATGNSAGGDVITGNTNADIISDNNGTAADTLIGNSSTGDTFLVQNVNDLVSEAGSGLGSIVNVEKSGATGVAFTLAGTGATELKFTVGTGADTATAAATGNDTLIGNTGNDIFHDGGASTVVGFSDNMQGNSAAGADTFYVNNTGDLVTEAGTATAALISTTVSFNLNTGAAGGTTTNVNELTLTGTATGATLTGNALNDTITDSTAGLTNGGNVLADGAAGTGNGGHDTMIDNSTAGGDTFIVNSVFDSIAENGLAKGTVESSVNYTLGANFNVLTLEGSANAATGNAAGGDTISGSTVNAVISDNNGAAADSLIGHSTGSGDTFVVYNGADTVLESGSTTGSLVQLQSGATNANFTLAGSNVHKVTMYGTGNDTATGTTGGDTITGNTGNDYLSDGGAGTGADSLVGHSSTGGDTFEVNNANDIIVESANVGGAYDGIVTSLANDAFDSLTGNYAGFYNLTLNGITGSTAVGNNLANVITGNYGDDTIISGTGADTLIGRDTTAGGGDTFEVNNAVDSVTEVNAEANALIKSDVNFSLVSVGGHGVNQLTLTAGNITATGNAQSDVLTGDSAGDVLITTAGAGANTIVAGTGLETFIINNSTDVITESHAGTGSIVEAYANFTLGANLKSLTLENGAATTGVGNATGGDTITGNTNNDLLSDGGSASAGDQLIGNSTAGDDTFLISNTNDTITETNAIGALATIESTINYTLGGSFQNLELVMGAHGKTAIGNSVNDVITDNSTAGGNMLSDGNNGASDTLIDNAGNDTFVVNSTNDSVTEAHASTSSEVDSSVSFTLGANMNNLVFEGAGNVTGKGIATGGNSITGNTGNDVLDDNGATSTADTLIGYSAAGHDTFVVHNTADVIQENGAANGNMVEVWGTYSVASIAGIEKITLEAGSSQTITGNNDNDTLTDATSGAHSNILVSGTGADSFVDSNATSLGDTFYANNAADQFSEAHGNGTVIWGNGLNVTYTLGTNITSVTLTGAGSDSITANNVTGGDTIYAASGAGTNIISDGLAGGLGNDTMYAGAGSTSHDTFIMNNAGDVVVGSNTGWSGDVIDFYLTNATYTLGANINNLVIESTGGNGNVFDTIYANTGNDVISANTHSNTFYDGGVHGADTMAAVTSAGGADTFNGGGGFDVFYINNANDVINETNPGQYLVYSWANYTLSTNLGNLTLEGGENLSGTATAVGGAVIVGNTGSDVLSDGGNATVGVGDTLIGNARAGQSDTFIVNNTADTVSENGAGLGTVEASVSYTLGLGTTHLLMLGNGNLHATGNSTASQADIIVGNTGNDVLGDGGNDTGAADNSVVGHNADTMIGHSGSTGDTFMVYNAGDSITELGGATGSVIDAYANYTLVSNVNTGNIMGNGVAVTLTGNSAADVLTDNGTSTAGGNVLKSGTGADTLVDASTTGGDTFYVNNTNDSVTEGAGTGVVYSTVSFDLGTVTGTIDTLNLTGSANMTATAAAGGGDTINAQATTGGIDILVGTGGNDVLKGSTTAGVHTTFVVNVATDTVTASAAAAANNTIETSLNTTFNDLGAAADTNVRNLILTAGHQTGTASGTASNSIIGQGGNDTLSDTAGDTHADTLTGTGGNDVFNVHNVNDVVTESGASATVNADVNFTMGANILTLNLTGAGLTGTGNNGADLISTSGAGDVLIGGLGADTLTGNGAGDVFYVNSAATATHVTESHAGAAATVHSDVSFTLGANMSTLSLSGDINLTGTGNGGAVTINGNQGDDDLVDGGGAATMIGNSVDGGDTFDVSNASDSITESFTGTTALVNISFDNGTLTLGSNIENVAIAASHGGDTIIGNGSASNLTMIDSGTGGDVLNANGTGADTLTDNSTGGGDTFDVNNALDVVSELHGTTGVVNYLASGNHSFTLSTHITTLDAHTVSGNDTFVGGSTGGDSISGSTGSDVLNDAGGTGGDTITGHAAGGHFDTFIVTNASDVIDEAGAGTGIIEANGLSWSLASNTTNVTTLEISGTGHTATGITTAAVTLEDLSGGNTLTTGTASTHNDTLIGGADTMNLSSSGSAHDTVEFSAAAGYNGIATINNFSVANSTLDIDNIITGSNGGLGVTYKFVDDGTNTKVYVDYDHTNVGYSFIQVATLEGITGETLSSIHVS